MCTSSFGLSPSRRRSRSARRRSPSASGCPSQSSAIFRTTRDCTQHELWHGLTSVQVERLPTDHAKRCWRSVCSLGLHSATGGGEKGHSRPVSLTKRQVLSHRCMPRSLVSTQHAYASPMRLKITAKVKGDKKHRDVFDKRSKMPNATNTLSVRGRRSHALRHAQCRNGFHPENFACRAFAARASNEQGKQIMWL